MQAITKHNITSPAAADELIERATRSYARFCEREGSIPQQPSKDLSTFDPETMLVTLANVRGTLATFRYNISSNRLRYVETTEAQS